MDFERIIKENKQNIKNIIRLITKEDNDDIEQEVYVKIWKNMDKCNGKNSVKSWVSVIAKNTSIDYLKSLYRRIFSTSSSIEDDSIQIKDNKISPESNVISIENRRRIIECINRLKPKFREVIILCEMKGYSYEECAKKLKCPVGTIKSRLFNAKKIMSIELEDLL